MAADYDSYIIMYCDVTMAADNSYIVTLTAAISVGHAAQLSFYFSVFTAE